MPKTSSWSKRVFGILGIGAAMGLAMTVGFVTGERRPQHASPAPTATSIPYVPLSLVGAAR
jgi:hypothetical protein